ncbi:MAG: hypothetical protein ACP5KJ_03675 [Candidatus Micrarchaeia archaeon]
MVCGLEVTTEEYVAHFDADACTGYPKVLHYKNEEYLLIAKEFKYTTKGSNVERHFLRVEIWDSAQEKIQMMILLIKSDGCRFHSPANPNFDISEEVFNTELGLFLMDKFIETISKFGYSFLVEEIFPDELGYNRDTRTYDVDMYNKLKKFYEKFGFQVYFDANSGKGYMVLKNEPLSEKETSCYARIVSGLVAV